MPRRIVSREMKPARKKTVDSSSALFTSSSSTRSTAASGVRRLVTSTAVMPRVRRGSSWPG